MVGTAKVVRIWGFASPDWFGSDHPLTILSLSSRYLATNPKPTPKPSEAIN
jgi:hypothetical protein